jgi:hypothetical protein
MFKQDYSPSTVKAYLSGISYYIKSNGLEDVTQSFIIQKMMRGIWLLFKFDMAVSPIRKYPKKAIENAQNERFCKLNQYV